MKGSEQPKREIKSFVCRNRKLSDNHQKLLDEYYPKWGLANNQDWDFIEIFSTNLSKKSEDLDIIIEIGFGTGETLIQNALDNPENNYIGIEMYQSGCLNILNYLKNNHLPNLRVCFGNAKEILSKHIQNSSLAGVQIFFPDPWPKKKHHKRRLIQTDFVNLLAQKIKSNGFLHLATDWVPYAEHMVEVLNNNRSYNREPQDRARHLTKFESKGLAKGHEVRDLVYRLL